MLGTRDPSKNEVIKWKEENSSANVGTFEETASYGEIIILAVSGLVAEEAIKRAYTGGLCCKGIQQCWQRFHV